MASNIPGASSPIEADGRTARAEIRLRVRLSYDIYRIILSVYQRNAQDDIVKDPIVVKLRRGEHAFHIISLDFLLFAAFAMTDSLLSCK